MRPMRNAQTTNRLSARFFPLSADVPPLSQDVCRERMMYEAMISMNSEAVGAAVKG